MKRILSTLFILAISINALACSPYTVSIETDLTFTESVEIFKKSMGNHVKPKLELKKGKQTCLFIMKAPSSDSEFPIEELHIFISEKDGTTLLELASFKTNPKTGTKVEWKHRILDHLVDITRLLKAHTPKE